MAPEQLAGGAADARSDQYAFCVALHEALYGRRPFHAATVAELAAVAREPAPTPRRATSPGCARPPPSGACARDPRSASPR